MAFVLERWRVTVLVNYLPALGADEFGEQVVVVIGMPADLALLISGRIGLHEVNNKINDILLNINCANL